jgi:hypothetical protein
MRPIALKFHIFISPSNCKLLITSKLASNAEVKRSRAESNVNSMSE